MFIGSQDGKRLVNLDMSYDLFITSPFDMDGDKLLDSHSQYDIYASNGNDNWDWLGTYASEDDAKKVLKSISRAVRNEKRSRYNSAIMSSAADFYFEMPSDSEGET